MRTARNGTFAFIIAWLCGAIIITTASANHGYDPKDVVSCNAYEYVLEDAQDQLITCVFSTTELSHATSSDDVGAAGLLMVLEQASVPIDLITVPRLGVGLAAFYFSSSDVSSPTWDSSTVDVYLTENPGLFASPTSGDPITLNYYDSTSTIDTQELIALHLSEQLLQIEFIDPTISIGSLIGGNGISLAGKVYADEAFPYLALLAASAFELVSETVIAEPDSTLTVPAALNVIQAIGRNSYFATGIVTFGKLIGQGYTAAGLIINAIIIGLIGIALWKLKMSVRILYWTTIPMLLIDAYLDIIGFEIFIIYVDLLAWFGIGMFINRHQPS